MHEHSLIKTLIAQVREIAQHNNASAVTEVVVEIGPLAGVEPLLLMSAFEQSLADDSLRGARLILVEVPLTIQCDLCRREATLHSFVFACPHCGSVSTQVVRGEHVILRHVELSLLQVEEASR